MVADGLVLVDVANGVGEHGTDRQHLDFRGFLLLGDGVGEDYLGEAGTLCVSPRRFGIVTDDVPAAAALAEEFRRPAVVPEENREVKSC